MQQHDVKSELNNENWHHYRTTRNISLIKWLSLSGTTTIAREQQLWISHVHVCWPFLKGISLHVIMLMQYDHIYHRPWQITWKWIKILAVLKCWVPWNLTEVKWHSCQYIIPYDIEEYESDPSGYVSAEHLWFSPQDVESKRTLTRNYLVALFVKE